MKNQKLADAIYFSGKTQKEIAEEIGIPETTLSAIKNGTINPNDEQKQKIADYFNKKIEELF